MKIYLVTKRVEHYINKFIPELVYGLKNAGNDVAVGTDILWTESVFDYDIIYFHWPEFLFAKATSSDCVKLKKRIQELKNARKMIVAHCHNLKPHDSSKKIEKELYNIVYGDCDIMIHMGEFSLKKMQEEYPQARHFIVPHHIYSHFCPFDYEKILSRKNLGLSEKKCIVLCFGAFRNDAERQLFLTARKRLNAKEYELVAPNIVRGKVLQKNLRKGLRILVDVIKYKLKRIRFSTKYVNDDDMQRYFCAADVVLIQRPDILNSGNLPMGFAAGKVVVGPDVGNIFSLLTATNNPVFNVGDDVSLIQSIEKARNLAREGMGNLNKKFAEAHWTPEVVGQSLTAIFKKVCNE